MTSKGIAGSIPDIIVKLPDGEKVIIDSKVSLSDYNDYLKTNDELNRVIFLKNINYPLKIT